MLVWIVWLQIGSLAFLFANSIEDKTVGFPEVLVGWAYYHCEPKLCNITLKLLLALSSGKTSSMVIGVVAGYRGADHPPYPVTSSCDWAWSSSSELAC